MKITGTKSYIQIEEENGNIARFDGGSLSGGILCICQPPSDGSRHRGETTDGDRIYLAFCVGSLIICQSVSHLDAADLQVPARSRGLRRYVYSCFWKK